MAKKPTIPPETGFPHGMGQPAYQAITLAGYTRLEQLTTISKKELLALHGVGPKAVRILEETLAVRGLAFAPEAPKVGKGE